MSKFNNLIIMTGDKEGIRNFLSDVEEWEFFSYKWIWYPEARKTPEEVSAEADKLLKRARSEKILAITWDSIISDTILKRFLGDREVKDLVTTIYMRGNGKYEFVEMDSKRLYVDPPKGFFDYRVGLSSDILTLAIKNLRTKKEENMNMKVVDEFVENMKVCSKCMGNDDGCGTCGQWYPYINPEKMYPEEYKAADFIFSAEDEKIDVDDLLIEEFIPRYVAEQFVTGNVCDHCGYKGTDLCGQPCEWDDEIPVF